MRLLPYVLLIAVLFSGCYGNSRAAISDNKLPVISSLWGKLVLFGDLVDDRLVFIAKDPTPYGPNNTITEMAVSLNYRSLKIYAENYTGDKLAFIYNGEPCVYDSNTNAVFYRYLPSALCGITDITWDGNVIEMWSNGAISRRIGVKTTQP